MRVLTGPSQWGGDLGGGPECVHRRWPLLAFFLSIEKRQLLPRDLNLIFGQRDRQESLWLILRGPYDVRDVHVEPSGQYVSAIVTKACVGVATWPPGKSPGRGSRLSHGTHLHDSRCPVKT